MKVRAIIPDTEVSSWYRVIVPFKRLRALGHDVSWHLQSEVDANTVDFDDALVLLHRIICLNSMSYFDQLENRGAKAFYYSLDDLIISKDAVKEHYGNAGGITSRKLQSMVDNIDWQLETMLHCKAVIVTTQSLDLLVSQYTPIPAIVIPNAIDRSDFARKLDERVTNERVVIGWAGGRRPEADLVKMAKAWGFVSELYEHVDFQLGGWEPDIIYKYVPIERVVHRPWVSIEEYPKSMQVDIGCCPLDNTLFNYGKSPNKYFEYTLAGAAVVASTTVYDKVLTHTFDGLLAMEVKHWIKHLSYLIENKRARRAMQRMALRTFQIHSDLDVVIDRWVEVLTHATEQ